MDALKCLCPTCNLIFEAHPAQSVVTCPVCDTPIGTRIQAPAPAAPPPVASPGRSWRGLAALVALAFLSAGIGLVVQGFSVRPHESPAPEAVHAAPGVEEPSPEIDPIVPPPQALDRPPLDPPHPIRTGPPRVIHHLFEDDVQPIVHPQALSKPRIVHPIRTGPPRVIHHLFEDDVQPIVHPQPPSKPRKLHRAPRARRIARASKPVPGSLAARVNEAIDRGVAYLHQHGYRMGHPSRYEGLLGLTLLECDVEPSDPVVQRIAASLRSQAPTLDKTYELSIAIFFFDRLGHAADARLIRLFADRLVHGQTESGMWSYTCPLLRSPSELETMDPPWKRVSPLSLPAHPGGLANPSGFNGRKAIAARPVAPGFSNYQAGPAVGVWPNPAGRRIAVGGDHSNTQFALMGLWIAQRHGAKVRAALAATSQHFHTTQAPDGGWSYKKSGVSTFSNTCAGLLGLAVQQAIDQGIGRRAQPRFLPVQPGSQSALAFLSRRLSPNLPLRGMRDLAKSLDGRDYYALWSMERVGTVYGLEQIGVTKWYPWAAEVIVRSQDAIGGWRGPVDTCFALLVLRRSNLLPDLTEAITGRDPRRLEKPLLTEKPHRSRPPESGVIARPAVPVPQGGIVPKPGARDRVPDERGIAPRAEAIANPQGN